MEGTAPGSTMALATSTFPGNARPRLGTWHRPGMAPGGEMGKCILSGGRERRGCELCLWGQRTAPSHSSSKHFLVDWRWQHLSSVPAGVWKEQVASCRSSPWKQWGCPTSCAADPSPREDAQGSGPPLSRGDSVSQLQWQQGVMLTLRICLLAVPGRRVP